MRQALAVEPGFIIEADRINDKRVAVPFCNGIAHPQRFEILRMASAVKKELAITMDVPFVKNDDERECLNEFLGKRRNPRDAGRQTMPFRIILAQIGPALLI